MARVEDALDGSGEEPEVEKVDVLGCGCLRKLGTSRRHSRALNSGASINRCDDVIVTLYKLQLLVSVRKDSSRILHQAMVKPTQLRQSLDPGICHLSATTSGFVLKHRYSRPLFD